MKQTREHHAHDQTSVYHQVISCVHPYKKERSLEELLAEELEYYTLYLANDYKTEEHSRCSEIPLECFLQFPRVSKLANDIGVLRYAITEVYFVISSQSSGNGSIGIRFERGRLRFPFPRKQGRFLYLNRNFIDFPLALGH
jgi:hypothetical protein